MQGFHELGDAEEFDWFFEETPGQETMDYESIQDLKQMASKDALHEIREPGYECGDIEEDGQMWEYREGLAAAMRGVFCAVSEKLCGYGILDGAANISECLEQLSKKCEVVQSGIYQEDCMDTAHHGQAWLEPAARIEACLLENGCVIALVADEQWRGIKGEAQTPFADSGVRGLQVIGLKGQEVIVNDFADENGRCLHVPIQCFCSMHGILAEVYK